MPPFSTHIQRILDEMASGKTNRLIISPRSPMPPTTGGSIKGLWRTIKGGGIKGFAAGNKTSDQPIEFIIDDPLKEETDD